VEQKEKPSKYAVRNWLSARQRNRVPPPERTTLLRDLHNSSLDVQDEGRVPQPGSDVKDADLV